MQCGYCAEIAVAWIEWPTTGRPKGAMVCERHLAERDVPDNFGHRITVERLTTTTT